MSEAQRYFDLEINDVISFYVGHDECKYPLTFTVEECVEEYCEMRNMDLVKIHEDFPDPIGHIRSGTFWYEKHEELWTDTFNNIINVQQAVTRMGSSMAEITDTMRNVQEQMQGWSLGDEE